MAVQVASVIWQDYQGKTRQTIIRTSTGAAAILVAAQANSWARIQTYWESASSGPLGIAANNDYATVGVCVQLQYQTAAGSILKLNIPAPVLSGAVNPNGIFLADKITVDPTQITALNALVIGNLCDPAGNVVVSYLGGTLQPTKLELPNTQ